MASSSIGVLFTHCQVYGGGLMFIVFKVFHLCVCACVSMLVHCGWGASILWLILDVCVSIKYLVQVSFLVKYARICRNLRVGFKTISDGIVLVKQLLKSEEWGHLPFYLQEIHGLQQHKYLNLQMSGCFLILVTSILSLADCSASHSST